MRGRDRGSAGPLSPRGGSSTPEKSLPVDVFQSASYCAWRIVYPHSFSPCYRAHSVASTGMQGASEPTDGADRQGAYVVVEEGAAN